MMQITIAPKKPGDDHWLAWIFPEGSRQGTIRAVRSWDDVEQLARDHGAEPDDVKYVPLAVGEMHEELGPPPGHS